MAEEQNFQTTLNTIVEKIHEADDFYSIMPSIEQDLCKLLDCKRITVYQRGKTNKEIVSKYKSGDDEKEIKVPLSATSIAGYTALSQHPLLIKDAYNQEELKSIHQDLQFNKSWDKKTGFTTKSVITVPIKFKEVLLGVLQILNKVNGEYFTETDLGNAEKLSKILGQKFRYELRGTRSPYDHLVQTKKIKPHQLQDLAERAKTGMTTISELIISEGLATKAELGTSLEHFYQVPYMPYDPHHQIPKDLLLGINVDYLRTQLWVPVSGSKEDEVTILIDNPSDAQRIMEIQRSLPAKRFAFKVSHKEDILKFLGQGNDASETDSNLHDLVGKLQEELEEDVPDVAEQVEENDATVIQLVNRLIVDAYKSGSSDIHIEPGKGKATATVRFRIDGVCQPSLSIPATHVSAVVSRIKIMSALDISERRKPQDGKCVVRYRGEPIELRVATIPTVNGEGVVMRILASSEPFPLEQLNFSSYNLENIKKLVACPHGIFLVVGPTGSGKTTTLHSILGSINTPDKKIWTAEDPVEITQPGLNQVQMRPQINLTFETALRAFLRADPDVIMIGEMRDRETAHAGVEASLTGHLVFSTLHTNSAPETVTRLLDLGLDPVSFSDALQGVLAQRLVRTLCKNCKEKTLLTDSDYTLLARYYGEKLFAELNASAGKTEIYKPKGCEKCNNTGYKGRTGIHELLVSSEAIKSLIYKGATAGELRDQAIKDGMRTLMQDGIQKLLQGQTDIDQIRKVAAS
ncbi:MAG: GspE/PulE family protein [Bdellovibrionales bacterium]|nr:GspE/PulE family protein [Bdellovibrionales bacterium]